MNQIKFIALGGLGEHGKNMYLVEVGERMFILDVGMKFPSVDLYGIDAVMPDFRYVLENKERVQGIFLSHGHDDHIGAVPELLKAINVGVFGTHFTISLLEDTLEEKGMKKEDYRLYRINDDKTLKFGNVEVSFFGTSHSIPESVGIAIKTTDGVIVYAPDFTFSSSSDKKYRTAFDKISDLAKAGVLALCPESLGTSNTNRTTNDTTMLHVLKDVLQHSKRTIFTLYSTDLDRIQKVINLSIAQNRKIAIIGRKAQKTVNIAMNTGYLKIPAENLVNLKYIDDKTTNEDENLAVIITGYRHEPFYTLQRMANKQDRLIHLNDKDHVVIVSPPMPGTEKIASKTMDLLHRVDTKITILSKQDLRSSHANAEDLKILYNILHPKYIIPIIGEYRHQYMHKQLALDAGYEEDRILVVENGDVIVFENGKALPVKQKVASGDVLIDGSIVGDINEVVLKDREDLSQAGTVLLALEVDSVNNQITAGPEIVFKGFITGESAVLLQNQLIEVTNRIVENMSHRRKLDLDQLKTELRNRLGKIIFQQTKKNPIFIPVVKDIEGE